MCVCVCVKLQSLCWSFILNLNIDCQDTAALAIDLESGRVKLMTDVSSQAEETTLNKSIGNMNDTLKKFAAASDSCRTLKCKFKHAKQIKHATPVRRKFKHATQVTQPSNPTGKSCRRSRSSELHYSQFQHISCFTSIVFAFWFHKL